MGQRAGHGIRRIGLVVKRREARALPLVERLVAWARERGVELFTETNEAWAGALLEVVAPDELVRRADLIVVLGGDGTMIGTARMLGDRALPVLGVNFGTLGFLTEFTCDELLPALETIVGGEYRVGSRMKVECRVMRGDVERAHAVALNDVVVNKTAIARIIEVDCRIDGQFVTTFRADGLIVSTPTGSTAYNLSAGGPILMPAMGAFVINPICPHTISNRPLVVPDTVDIELGIRSRGDGIMVTVDGQIGFDVDEGDRVRVARSAVTFDVVLPPDRGYFRVLREKLRWGGQIAKDPD